MAGPRPFMRTRFTQTSPTRTHDAAVQFRTPMMDTETQIQMSASEEVTQMDYQAGFDNFGLSPGLDMANATRHRGVTERWITQGIELRHCTELRRHFTTAEKSNVDAVVRMMLAVRQDENSTLFSEISQFVRSEPARDQDNPMGSLSGTMPISVNVSGLPLDRAEGVREDVTD